MTRSAAVLAGVLLASYLLGGFCAGYFVVRLAAGRDVRASGSGSAGARNVGRVLGPAGFIVTLLLDAAKGAVAVLGAARLASAPWAPAAALVAVVAGHVWPLQLRLRGGKGVATAIGGVLAYGGLLLARQASGVLPVVASLAVTLAIVLFAHRDNFAAARARHRQESA